MNTFTLEIKTPNALVYSGKAESLIVPTPEGSEGYLANHETVITELTKGVLIFRAERIELNKEAPAKGASEYPIEPADEANTYKINIPGGFINFNHNKAIVFIR